MLHIILLSGGSGKRLWPLSNDVYSKQFIRLFRGADGAYESMMMRAYRGIRAAGDARITVATGENQVSTIRSQLGKNVELCTEPCRRDTFPAIALTASLINARGGRDDDVVVTCPVDAYVEEEYYQALYALSELVRRSDVRLTLMGVEPTEPSEKYGYILPAGKEKVSPVAAFHEKPSAEKAAAYIRQGALWNSGVFAFRLGYILEKARELLGASDYETLSAGYAALPRISFDYAVAEKEESIRVMRFQGTWKDIGTWNSLTEVLDSSSIGPVKTDDACKNLSVINQLNLPVLCMGVKNAVVCAAPDGILISDKEASVGLKAHMNALDDEPRYAEYDWGTYQALAADRNSFICRIVMQAGNRIRSHSHALRDECWFITGGVGEVLIDGERRSVGLGSVIQMPRGVRHGLLAREEMSLIEVQTGEYFGADDRQIYPEDGASV